MPIPIWLIKPQLFLVQPSCLVKKFNHQFGRCLLLRFPENPCEALIFCWLPSGKLTWLWKSIENHNISQFLMGKSSISMAMFNSYVTNYQRVNPLKRSIKIPLKVHWSQHLSPCTAEAGKASTAPGSPATSWMSWRPSPAARRHGNSLGKPTD